MLTESTSPVGAIDVVLVEDDVDDAFLISKRLLNDGFLVGHCRTLAAALPRIRANGRPVCVLLDLSLPDAEGLEGIARLQEHAPGVPVVVLTGGDDELLGLQAVAAGAQDYLVKDRISDDAVQRAIRYSVERKQSDAALAEVRERFRRTFEDGPLGIALVDLDGREGRIVEANRAIGAIVGRPPEELVGRRVDEFTHWEDRPAQGDAIAAVADGRERYSEERRLLRADGQVVWCTVTGSAVRDAAGKLVYGIALVDDVTDRKLQEEALREAHAALDTAVLGIAQNSPSGRCVTVNAYYAASLGYTRDELVGKNWDELVHPDDRDAMHAAIGRVLSGEHATVEVRALRKDGTTFIKDVVLAPNVRPNGALHGFFHFMRDVTDREHARWELAESEARYRRIIETSHDGVWVVDREGRTTFVNDRLASLLGHPPEALLGKTFLEFLHPDERVRGRRRFEARRDGPPGMSDYRFLRADGTEIWLMVSTTAMPQRDGSTGALAMLSDITARKGAEAEMTRLALTDDLTGLPNRAQAEERLRAMVRAAHGTDRLLGVVFIDLDRFKTINDGFGHEVGDELLRAAVPRLTAALDDRCTLARFGGDEFLVLCDDVGDEEEAVVIADRVLAALESPIELSIGSVTITASIGLAVEAGAVTTAENLVRDADTAMYRAKEAGRGRRELFDLSMRRQVLDELNLERDLRAAACSDELYLAYQPILTLPDERVAGFEALLRWEHPTRGSVSPATFIPLAERTGLIVEIGRRVLREGCRQIATWTADEEHDWANLAVNVSARQVDTPGFVDDLRAILAETGIASHRLHLEITETALFSRDAASTAATLRALSELGVTVVLDDFGTGYSSLSYLSLFELGGLKLDRAFIQDVETDAGRRAIVEAVTALAQSLGMTLVGEGVETVEQACLLASLGCDYAQGFLFSRPMPADAVQAWLATRTRFLDEPRPRSAGDAPGAWMSMGDAARALGISASTLRRWETEGRISAHRTAGGHRRFAVADLKQLGSTTSAPRLSGEPRLTRPLPQSAAFLEAEGMRLAEAVGDRLYEKPAIGWFSTDRARPPLADWVKALGRACRTGTLDEATTATVGLTRQAEVAGCTLLEIAVFVERFIAVVFATLQRAGQANAEEQVELRRALTAARHSVLAAR